MTTAIEKPTRKRKAKAKAPAAAPVEPSLPAAPGVAPVDPQVADAPAPPAADTAPAPPAGQATSVETGDEPTQPPEPTTPTVRGYDRLSQRLFLGELDDMLDGLDAVDEPMSTYMLEFKISPTFRAELATQLGECHTLVGTRRQSMANEMAAVRQLQVQREELDVLTSTLRQLARTVIHDPAARRALALDIRIPRKTRLYIDLTREFVNACRQEPYATLLATVQIDADQLDDIEARVGVLEMLYEARKRAGSAAVQATTARDEGFHILQQMVRLLTLRMNALLRTHPELPRPLGFEE